MKQGVRRLQATLHVPENRSKSAIGSEFYRAKLENRRAGGASLSSMSELRTAPSRPYSRRSDFCMLLRLSDVQHMVALGKTQIYELMAAGEFPKAIKIGDKCSRWHAQDVQNWIEKKRAATGAE